MIATERLILRQWRASDYLPFAQLNADPQVMEYFPSCLTSEESHLRAQHIQHLIEQQGWGFWALELKASGAFIGFTGLNRPTAPFEFNPCIEVGWRLARAFWGYGYATEAAQAALAFGFGELQLTEIVAFTAVQNQRSQAVMQRLGMSYHHDFSHPHLAEGHPLNKHCLYKISHNA
ncbi:GNAT family N-acetyltransferase [Thiofilum flexile]|uniref:GNAT family N-acetyltransferase n=1 Tax=Thiofilum flexile TaxID=125627 RepID=UPI000367964E|nr:GNAT family N-acetyltransferase [Thiofilum flexile]